MCLNRGIRDVLPPFGRQTSLSDSLKGSPNNLMHSPNDHSTKEADQFCKTEEVQHVIEHPQNIKNECDDLLSHGEGYCKVTNINHSPSSHEEGNIQPNCSVFSSVNLSEISADHTFTLPISSSIGVHKRSSNKGNMKDKRRRRRGPCKAKKRSMVDILAEARHCTLEEISRMNKFCYTTETVVTEGCHCQQQQMVPPFENASKSEPKGNGNSLIRSAASEDHEADNLNDVTGKGTLLVKFKLNGCNVNNM